MSDERKFRLRIVSEHGAVKGPPLTFEEAAHVLVVLHEEGFESVEGYVDDRAITDDEMKELVARATEIVEEGNDWTHDEGSEEQAG